MTSVLPTGPASDAGLSAGDIIVAVNGIDVTTDEELDAAVAAAGAGQTITLTVVRGRQTGDIAVVIAGR